MAAINGTDDVPGGPGYLPRSWLSHRVMGEAILDGEFAAVGGDRSLSNLRSTMAASLLSHGLEDLDAGTIRLTAPRALTQEISRAVYECSSRDERRAFDGIYYLSRLGDNFENLAIFEPATLRDEANHTIKEKDPDFQRVVAQFSLTLFSE